MPKNEIKIDDSFYKHIAEYARRKNITTEELLIKLLENEDKNKIFQAIEKLDISKLPDILLEDTGVFNYKGKQSSVYNRFTDNNIRTLKELFELYNSNKLNYGQDKMGNNLHIHEEMKGIIQILKYKYLNTPSTDLTKLLNQNIGELYLFVNGSHNYGFPGKVFNSMFYSSHKDHFLKLYKQLKSCGFNQSSTKALIDYAYDNNMNNIKLGDFLLGIKEEEIKPYFYKVDREYQPFITIRSILIDHYQKHNKQVEQPTKNK